MRLPAPGLDWHEVGEFGIAARGLKRRDEHCACALVSRGRRIRTHRLDAESPASLNIEECRKYRFRIERGRAKPVDRARQADESSRMQVADYTVAGNRRISALRLVERPHQLRDLYCCDA